MKWFSLTHFLILFFITIATACNNGNTSSTPVTDTLKKVPAVVADTTKIIVPIVTENDILNALNALSFVKKSNQLIDSVSHHKHAMAFIIDSADAVFNVKAGYDKEDRFETFYTFSVDKKTRAIKVLDVVTDEMITPEAFVKRQKGKH